MENQTQTLLPKEGISPKQRYWEHLIKYQAIYLLLLLLLVLIIPCASNYLRSQPVVMGGESYYHLSQAKELSWNRFYYLPLNLFLSVFSEQDLFWFQLILAIAFLFLSLNLAQKLKLESKFTFCFLALLIISPVFIFTFVTLSAYSVYAVLVLLGFTLLMQKNKNLKYLSFFLFILATFADLFSSIFLLMLLSAYLIFGPGEKKRPVIKLGIIAVGLISVINFFVLKVPFVLGPFHPQQLLSDFISDLGGLSGINFFTLLLAVIGMMVSWKKKRKYWVYLFLLLTLITYRFNTQSIFYLALILIFFAASGLVQLFEQEWNLVKLKRYTQLVLILSLLFSTTTYLERVDDTGPSSEMIKTLTWMRVNIPESKIVWSAPENSYYLQYFAEKKPFYTFAEKDENKIEQNRQISASLYIDELFPLLEQEQISIIYITKAMKASFPSDQGLLFLLKNERFKIVYSSEDAEVWVFN